MTLANLNRDKISGLEPLLCLMEGKEVGVVSYDGTSLGNLEPGEPVFSGYLKKGSEEISVGGESIPYDKITGILPAMGVILVKDVANKGDLR